jgi:hypothetical protein
VDKADISIALSILALLVTSVFWMRQNRLQGRITKIEEGRRDEEIEAKRHARVTAVIRWSGAAPRPPQPWARGGALRRVHGRRRE